MKQTKFFTHEADIFHLFSVLQMHLQQNGNLHSFALAELQVGKVSPVHSE